jgi:hypothetical protein
MSNSNEKGKKLDLIKENFNHARHVEKERLQFAQIYGAIVAGSFALSSIGVMPIQIFFTYPCTSIVKKVNQTNLL